MQKNEIFDFIKNNMFFELSTINLDGFPETRSLVNLMNENIAPHLVEYFKNNDYPLYMMTNTSTDKIKQIEKNHNTSIYFTDNVNFKGLLLTGKIEEVFDNKIKDELWVDKWKMYYRDGKDGGDFSILKFIPEKYKFYSGLSVEKGDIKW